MTKNIQQPEEVLSAFIDAEQSDIETAQIIDALLNDSELKQQYIRMQRVNDHLQDEVQHADIRGSVSRAIDALPAHFSEDAVTLQTLKTEDVSQSGWLQALFAKTAQHRMVSGLSVAASVMFVTLFTLQSFNQDSGLPSAATTIADNSGQVTLPQQNMYTPSLIQQPSALPATFVSGNSGLAGMSNTDRKQQYQWIEADPELSRQVRDYVNEHESRQAGYNLQPKIRTATYQLNK